MLLALQRLDLTRWGLNPALDTRVRRAHQGMLGPNNEEGRTREPNEWQVKINAEPVMLNRKKWHSTLTMTGRGTVIAKGTNDAGQLLAVKIYWPEAHRPKNHLIAFARDISQGDSDITNHLPTVFASQDFDIGFFPGSPSSLRVRSGPTISLQVGKPATLKDARLEKRSLFSKLQFGKNIATTEWTAEWGFAVPLLYWLQVEEGLRGQDQ